MGSGPGKALRDGRGDPGEGDNEAFMGEDGLLLARSLGILRRRAFDGVMAHVRYPASAMLKYSMD